MQMTFSTLIIKTVPYSIAAKSWVSEVKLCSRNSQITYLKTDSIFKTFGVSYVIKIYFSQADDTLKHNSLLKFIPSFSPPKECAIICEYIGYLRVMRVWMGGSGIL